MTDDLAKKVIDYVNRIRNATKQQYARRYAAWLADGMRVQAPAYDGLSVMGAQAVRLRLHNLFGVNAR